MALGFPLGIFGGNTRRRTAKVLPSQLDQHCLFQHSARDSDCLLFESRPLGALNRCLITVGLPIVGAMVRAVVALRSIPFAISWKHVHRNAFRHMANYSGITFMIIVGARLRFKTDALVIGAFLSSAAITYFYAGSRLLAMRARW